MSDDGRALQLPAGDVETLAIADIGGEVQVIDDNILEAALEQDRAERHGDADIADFAEPVLVHRHGAERGHAPADGNALYIGIGKPDRAQALFGARFDMVFQQVPRVDDHEEQGQGHKQNFFQGRGQVRRSLP